MIFLQKLLTVFWKPMVLFLISSVFFNSGNLYKTPDYSNADAQAVAVKTGLGYFALGLSKIGTELF
ncbi:hypothetical protein DXA17_19610, partial [Ruminococcus sp. AM58-7XD]